MTSKIIIKGKNIIDIATFYKEINHVFMRNEAWQIAESLDAFNDLLYGGFGVLKDYKLTEVIWTDAQMSRDALGYEATKTYYLKKLIPESPFNKKYFRDKLAELESGTGQTYFDIVIEILHAHANLILIMQ